MNEHLLVDLVCTDRGQHPSRRLQRLRDCRSSPMTEPDGTNPWTCFVAVGRDPRRSADNRYSGGRAPLVGSAPGRGDGGWEVVCPTCRRHPQLTTKSLGAITDALATRGRRTVIDVSRLPF